MTFFVRLNAIAPARRRGTDTGDGDDDARADGRIL